MEEWVPASPPGCVSKTVTAHSLDDGPSVGRLLALSHFSDVVDGHLVRLALLRDDILTGDPDHSTKLVAVLDGAGPWVHPGGDARILCQRGRRRMACRKVRRRDWESWAGHNAASRRTANVGWRRHGLPNRRGPPGADT